MELLQPRITLQNVQGSRWLVTWEHQLNENESFSLTLLTPKTDGLTQMQRAVLKQLRDHLTAMLDGMPDRSTAP